jgi:hypothetical protein
MASCFVAKPHCGWRPETHAQNGVPKEDGIYVDSNTRTGWIHLDRGLIQFILAVNDDALRFTACHAFVT